MIKTNAQAHNILLSTLIATVAVVALYSAHERNIQTKSTPVFYNEPIVIHRTIPSVNTAAKASVKEAAIAGSVPAAPAVTVPPVLMAPKVIFRVLPEFPVSALEEGIKGTVVLSVYVGTSGMPEKVETKISSGSELLDTSAVISVKQWKFEPARRGVQAIGCWFNVPVVFKIK